MGARYMTFQELLNDERAEERVLIAKKMIQRGMEIEDVRHALACLRNKLLWCEGEKYGLICINVRRQMCMHLPPAVVTTTKY